MRLELYSFTCCLVAIYLINHYQGNIIWFGFARGSLLVSITVSIAMALLIVGTMRLLRSRMNGYDRELPIWIIDLIIR